MYKLRELSRGDIAKINFWRNDKSVIDCLGAPFRYIDIEVDYEWYNEYLRNRNTQIRCAIVEDKYQDYILGLISLVNIDYLNRTAELHLMIGDKENQGKGIGYYAVRSILKHAFNNLNINRVELELLSTNLRAFNLYKKAGFVQEGIKKQAVFKNGEYIDVIMMSIIKDDYIE